MVNIISQSCHVLKINTASEFEDIAQDHHTVCELKTLRDLFKCILIWGNMCSKSKRSTSAESTQSVLLQVVLHNVGSVCSYQIPHVGSLFTIIAALLIYMLVRLDKAGVAADSEKSLHNATANQLIIFFAP